MYVQGLDLHSPVTHVTPRAEEDRFSQAITMLHPVKSPFQRCSTPEAKRRLASSLEATQGGSFTALGGPRVEESLLTNLVLPRAFV